MLILTKKRQARIEELLETAFNIPPGDEDMEEGGWIISTIAAREFVRMELDLVFRSRWTWRFWRWGRTKKCATIPCPPFEDVVLNVEEL